MKIKPDQLLSIGRAILLVLLGILLAAAAAMEIAGRTEIVECLADMGFGDGWRMFIGRTELAGVAGLCWRPTRLVALICLWPYAVDGLALHIGHHQRLDRVLPPALASFALPVYAFLRVVRQRPFAGVNPWTSTHQHP